MARADVDKRETGRREEEAIGRFETYLREKGLRATPERRLVLRLVLDQEGHFDAEELLALIRRRGSRVSRATLYRTVDHLRAAGLLRAHRFGTGQAVYEHTLGRGHHDHMLCERCGRVIEFVNDEIEALQDDVCRRHGFRPTHHVMQIFGVCAECDADAAAAARMAPAVKDSAAP